MKNLLFTLLAITISYTHLSFAQQTKNFSLTTKDLVGVWQYGSPRVGDQLNQSFVFFSDKNFTFGSGKLGDDLVSTLGLKGKYRLVKEKIYFTITSRVIIDSAKIDVGSPTVDFGIFKYTGCALREIKELNPKEITDPADLTVVNLKHIKINDEDYYKVSSNPNDASKL